jgi:PAS domain S-box-containing protein
MAHALSEPQLAPTPPTLRRRLLIALAPHATLALLLTGAARLAIHFVGADPTTGRGAFLLGLCFGAFTVLLLALALHRRLDAAILGPLERLTAAARRLGEAPANAPRIPVETDDEIGALAGALNTMAERLQRHGEALRQSSEQFQAVFEAAGDAIFIHDAATGRVLDVNGRVCEMYGTTRERILTSSADEFSLGEAPYSAAEAFAWFGQARHTPQLFEWLARDGAGRLFWVEVHMRWAQIGDQERVVACVRSIDRRKHSETELLRARDELETRVAERTRELEEALQRLLRESTAREAAQAGLIRSERLAAVGTLAGGVAHEFNNINTAILGFAEHALRQGPLAAEQEHAFRKIRLAALRARDITASLLTFAGQKAPRPSAGNLSRITAETVALVRRECESDGVELALALGEVPDSAMDESDVGQVVLNLLINARHAVAGASPRRIEVATGITPGGSGELWLRVGDTGSGIPREHLTQIFTPFFTTKGEHAQGDARQASLRGTGLGLSVCHTIVERHGGTITVESELERGSTFLVRLPMRSPPATTPTPDPLPIQSGAGQRILVIEDEPDIRDIVALILRSAGYEPELTDDGEEALAKVEAGGIALVLVDLQMPKMSGGDFLGRLEELPVERRPPCVVMTGRASWTQDQAELGAAGRPVEVVTKPFGLDELLAAIRRHVP